MGLEVGNGILDRVAIRGGFANSLRCLGGVAGAGSLKLSCRLDFTGIRSSEMVLRLDRGVELGEKSLVLVFCITFWTGDAAGGEAVFLAAEARSADVDRLRLANFNMF